MQAIGDVPGHYRIIVTNYLEDGTRGAANLATTGSVGIFRKRDNALMTSFIVSQTGSRQKVIYANEYCAEQRNLNFIVLTFEATIQLAPANYTDPQGYYMSYQTRNRNAGIDNINRPDNTGFTFYLEFPALQQNGQYVTNSTPHFGAINGEYVCLGEPFTYPFGGTDSDGDELRYSMVTPLDQNGASGNRTNAVSAAPYPEVSWLAGFGADNAIPGSPTLNIDPQTGKLAVTATKLGLYVFAVKVEEYRNGVKIGEVRRDFQLLVIECPPQTTPDPTVQIQNKPSVKKTTICSGDSAILVATVNDGWNYQWRRNGINITGATSSTLGVRESGEYALVVSQKATCSKTGNSEIMTVDVVTPQAKLYITGHLCATTGSVKLTAVGDNNVTYQWYRDNQALAGKTTDSLRSTEPGRYWAMLTQTPLGCKAPTDTTSITRSAAVQAVIKSASGFNRICPNDSLRLDGSGGVQYVWQKDGSTLATNSANTYARTPGTYVVKAIDSYGCEGTSPPVTIAQLAPVTPLLEPIPDVCGTAVPDHTLKGSPPGGDYGGTGVEENTFSAKRAGVGVYEVTYSVKAAPECAAVVATRTAVVAPIPTIQLPNSMTTYKGNTFTMDANYTGNPDQFQWASDTYLDNAKAANPSVRSIQNDITYVIDVKNSSGCETKDTIAITVYERVWVPDAFTPNGDGQNDTWELPGIEAFPDAIVTIFNRWGEIIFSSAKGYPNPFDGTLNGTSLPNGIYAYTLSTVPERPVLRGSLMIIR
jgi:gliding motility-associated-like protein